MRRGWLVVALGFAVAGGGCGSGRPVAQPTASATSSSPLDLPTSSTSHLDIPSGPPVNPTTPAPSKSPTWVECGKLPYESKNHNLALRAKATPPATCSQARTIVLKAFERMRANDSADAVTVSGWQCHYLPQLSTALFNDLHCVKGNLVVDGYIGDPNKAS